MGAFLPEKRRGQENGCVPDERTGIRLDCQPGSTPQTSHGIPRVADARGQCERLRRAVFA